MPDPSEHPDCQVNDPDFQEHVSRIPANIGDVRCQVLVWDHDPFQGRPYQSVYFSMDQGTADETGLNKGDIQFQSNAAFLKPIFRTQDMFLATRNPNGAPDFVNPASEPGDAEDYINEEFDILGSQACGGAGNIAHARLPGGQDWARDTEDPYYDPWVGFDMFHQQLWLHVGSLLKHGVMVHPSEYGKVLTEVNLVNKIALAEITRERIRETGEDISTMEITAAPKFDYSMYRNPHGKDSVWATMVSKQLPTSAYPVHWTIEKYLPTFQGEDFFIVYAKGEKRLDQGLQKAEAYDKPKSDWPGNHYRYLIYDPDGVEDEIATPGGTPGTPPRYDWVQGISNEAFYIPPGPDEISPAEGVTEDDIAELRKERTRQMRDQYWWGYKSYLLVELGAGDLASNYFIEFVAGRYPRFLHLGLDYDHPDKNKKDGTEDPYRWGYIRKCRVLSEYKGVSSDTILESDQIRMSVRHHLGDLVITFQGYEQNPWVVRRTDNSPGANNTIVSERVPVVVPNGTVRIHGGNLSCSLNFSITTYPWTAVVPFRNRQADAYQMQDEDIYMTFANIGRSVKSTDPASRRLRDDFYLDEKGRFGPKDSIKISFDSDAGMFLEFHKNQKSEGILFSEYFTQQWLSYGKGYTFSYACDPDAFGFGTGGEVSDPTELGILAYPHTLAIVNLDGDEPFILNQSEAGTSPFGDDDETEYYVIWNPGVQFYSGSVMLPEPEMYGIDPVIPWVWDYGDEKTVRSCGVLANSVVTPICTGWRMVVLEGAKTFSEHLGDDIEAMDIGPLVERLSDGWTAEGLTSMNHEASLTCYIPLGKPTRFELDPHDRYPDVDLEELGRKLLSLHDKHFYISIKYWWEYGVGRRDAGSDIDDSAPVDKRMEWDLDPEDADQLIQMTGIVTQTQLERSANKLRMNLTVRDYKYILEKQFIFNSPFFDGVDDVTAVWELGKMAGLDDDYTHEHFEEGGFGVIDRRPLGLLRFLMENRPDSGRMRDTVYYNGEKVKCSKYNLPMSYANIMEPAIRFNNGSTYTDALAQLASLGTKAFYFDRFGVLRFESIPAIDAAFTKASRTEYQPVFQFRTSPFPLPESPDVVEAESVGFDFDPNEHAAHLVWNTYSWSRSVQDCVSQIVLLTASNEIDMPDGSTVGGYIVEGHTFYKQIYDPTSEGYIGFRKPLYQSNGVFGTVENLRKTLAHYSRMKYPPCVTTFETYGVPGLKALDLITLDDNIYYITEISHEIDASENNWWMNITAEWLKPFQGVLCFLDGSCVGEEPEEDAGAAAAGTATKSALEETEGGTLRVTCGTYTAGAEEES